MPQVMAMKDGFETNAVSADWDSQSGTLVVNETAARDGKYGLEASTSSTLEKAIASTDHVRIGFWLHPNNISVTSQIIMSIVDSSDSFQNARVVLNDQVGYRVRGEVELSASVHDETSWYTISGWTYIEIRSRIGHNGETWLKLYIDHEYKETITVDGGGGSTWEDLTLGIGGAGSGTCYLDSLTARAFSSNGTDVFVIHPKDPAIADITCTLQDDLDNQFHIVTGEIKTHDAQRAKATYAEGELGGSARRITHGLANFDFSAILFGSTPEEADENEDLLRRALTSPLGGTIEYKPRGRDSHVMNTFYHYLPSPPPEPIGKHNRTREWMYNQIKVNAGGVYGSKWACKVKTLARATSDPDDILEILIEEIIGTYASADPDNRVVVPPTLAMGDAIIPIVKVRIEPNYSSPQNSCGALLVYKREAESDSNHGLEWMEAETSEATNRATWSSSTHAGGSGSTGGYLYRTNVGYLLFDAHTNMDTSYVGKVTPVVLGGKSGSGTWTFRLRWRRWVSGTFDHDIEEIGTQDVVGQIHDLNYFEEVDFPPFPIRAADQADPAFDLETYLGDLWVELYAVLTGSGEARVDALMLFTADDWISLLMAPLTLEGTEESQFRMLGSAGNDSRLEVDAVEQAAFLFNEDSEFLTVPWEAEGSPIPALELRRGAYSVLGFVPMNGRSDTTEMPYVYDSRVELMVAVDGIYSTITPFEEP
jgi:hypothetical protein